MKRLYALVFLYALACGLCAFSYFCAVDVPAPTLSGFQLQTDNGYDIGSRTLRVYSTRTDASNYERVEWSGTTDSFPVIRRAGHVPPGGAAK